MDLEKKSGSAVKTWLFNPFYYVAGLNSLAAGLVAILLTSVIGSFSASHFDGVLDFHTGFNVPFWLYIAEGLIDWIIMGGVLCIAGFVISKSRFRVIDVFGTQALARVPALITAAAALLPGYRLFSTAIAYQPGNFAVVAAADPTGFKSFIVMMFVVITMTVWMVMLMYRAFAVSCNVSGAKAVVAFIVSIIVAEIVSKVIIIKLFVAALS